MAPLASSTTRSLRASVVYGLACRVVVVVVVSLAVLLGHVDSAQTNTTSLCSPHATPPLLRKGEVTYVCINVNDEFRAVFMPVADKFTVLRVTDCAYSLSCCLCCMDWSEQRRPSPDIVDRTLCAAWNDSRIGANPNGAFVSVSSGAFRSFYKLYASGTGRVYPYLTAIISTKKGVVRSRPGHY